MATTLTYADPTRCPGCGGAIEYGAARCPVCDLSLTGPVATALFGTLAEADRLIAQLRAPGAVPVSAVPTVAASPPAPAASRLTTASVPKILLGLGALCLLVAAAIFLAVAWSVLGVAGRTVVLLLMTLLAGTLAWLLARRSLRGSAEALGLVALGLVAVDLVGARHSGWLGHPSDPTFAVVSGGAVAAVAAIVSLAARRTPLQRLIGAQVVAAVGTAVAAAGIAFGDWATAPSRLVVATVAAAGVAAGLELLRLRVAAIATACVAALCWLALAADAVVELADEPSIGHLWGHLAAWPGVAAAALAAVAAPVSLLPALVRRGLGSLAVLTAAITLSAFAWDEGATWLGVTALVALVGFVGLLVVLPEGARPATYLSLIVAAVLTGAVSLAVAAHALGRLVESATHDGRFADSLPAPRGDWPAGWLLPLGAAGLALALIVALPRVSPESTPRGLLRPATAAVGVTAAVSPATYAVPLWVVVAAALVVATGCLLAKESNGATVALGVGVLAGGHSIGLALLAGAGLIGAAAWGTRTEHRAYLWLRGALLAALSWVRLADVDVQEPEPYTLPSAVALVVAGLVRMRRDTSLRSLSALGAGLGLALLPSLLWMLDDPESLRALLLGLGCLALVLAGVGLRWAAPLLAGAVVGAIVVVRQLAPIVAEHVDPWIVVGVAGVVLVGLGATWEHRLNDARRLSRYVGALR